MAQNNNLPISSREVDTYNNEIKRTTAYLRARNELRPEYETELQAPELEPERKNQLVRALSRQTLGLAGIHLNNLERGQEPFAMDRPYNEMVGLLFNLNEGRRRLDKNIGVRRENKRPLTEFNGALKHLINTHPAITRRELRKSITNTLFHQGYEKNLADYINFSVTPGMEHELAGEANLYYLSGAYEVIDTTPEQDLNGVDNALYSEQDDIYLTIDWKASLALAEQAQQQHDKWRAENGKTDIDTHLILYTGYTRDDFSDQVGRVTEAARERQQPILDARIEAKRQEVLLARQNIDSSLQK